MARLPRTPSVVASLLLASLLAACGGAEQRHERHMARGHALFEAGNFEKARIEFRNAMQVAPTEPEGRYMAARTAERVGDLREAAGLYQATIDVDPTHTGARTQLGRLYVFARAPERALELVEPALVTAPRDPDLLTVRGAAALQQSRIDDARRDAQLAVEIAPDNEAAIAMLAAVYRAEQRLDAAAELLAGAVERLPKSEDLALVLAQLRLDRGEDALAEQELRRLTEIDPADAAHWYRLAGFYSSRDRTDEAEALIRRVATQEPQATEAKLAVVEFVARYRGADAAAAEIRKLLDAQGGDPELRLGLAALYARIGQAENAEAAYRALITEQGDRPPGLEARNRLAALALQTGRADEAARLVGEVLASNERDVDALVLRGNLALARGDVSAAITDLRAALRDQPRAVGILRTLARAHLQNGETQLAEEHLRAAVEAAPADPDARIDLAQLFAQTARAPRAVDLLREVVADQPRDPRALEALFRAQSAARDWSGASASAVQLQALLPGEPLPFYLAGVAAEAANRPADAEREFRRALQIKPDLAEPLAALTRVLLREGSPARARALLEATLKDHPRHTVAQNLLGEVHFGEGRHAAAEAAFARAIELSPQWWLPYRGLAAARAARDDRAGADRAYAEGIEATDFAPALAFDAASYHERSGRIDDAIRLYDELLTRDPRLDAAANNLAMLLVERGGEAGLARAVGLAARFENSDNPAFLDTHGWVAFHQGDYVRAQQSLEKALRLAPDSAVIRYHLGAAQARAGRTEEARRHLEAALASSTSFPERNAAGELLAAL